MKKFIASALVCAIILTVTACGSKKSDPSEGAGKDSVTRAAESTADVTDSAETPVSAGTGGDEDESSARQTETQRSPDTTDSGAEQNPPQSYTADQLAALDSTKNGWGQGVNCDELNRPTGATYAQNVYGQYGGVYIMPETDAAYLTFDLGYEYGCTGRILDTLKEKGAKGTFFVTMQYVTANPELVRRIIDEGHVLGNHSVNHLSMPTLSISDMESEIMGLHNYVRENFGYEMYLFRPPMGEFSVQSLAATQNLGYRSVFWSYAYYDYDVNNQPDTAEAYAKVTGAAHKGAVYLLHGVSETNTAILGDVIDYLRSSGIGTADGWS